MNEAEYERVCMRLAVAVLVAWLWLLLTCIGLGAAVIRYLWV